MTYIWSSSFYPDYPTLNKDLNWKFSQAGGGSRAVLAVPDTAPAFEPGQDSAGFTTDGLTEKASFHIAMVCGPTNSPMGWSLKKHNKRKYCCSCICSVASRRKRREATRGNIWVPWRLQLGAASQYFSTVSSSPKVWRRRRRRCSRTKTRRWSARMTPSPSASPTWWSPEAALLICTMGSWMPVKLEDGLAIWQPGFFSGTTSVFSSGRTARRRRRSWALDRGWKHLAPRSGWPPSTTTGGCSSTQTGTSWKATVLKTGFSSFYIQIFSSNSSSKVPAVLLQQHWQQQGFEREAGDNPDDWHTRKLDKGEGDRRGGRGEAAQLVGGGHRVQVGRSHHWLAGVATIPVKFDPAGHGISELTFWGFRKLSTNYFHPKETLW